MARYERTSRQNLPRKVAVRQRRHAQKAGSFFSSGFRKLADLGIKLGVKNLFKKGLDLGCRALTSEIGQKLIEEGIKHAPELYKIGTSKTKNNNLNKALEPDVANYIVEEKQGEKIDLDNLFGQKKMPNGITNFLVEEAFKNINDDNINDNFVGAFPSNHMNKFIDHASMISQKMGKYQFVVANTDNSSKSKTQWGSVLDN